MPADFTLVTEVAGSQATREQIEMIHARYSEAARLAPGRRVLEVASGPGRGLGLIARSARAVVGGDCTFSLLQQGAAHYRGRPPFVQLDAEALPFRDASFDLIVMFEAIYYLGDASRFLRDCRRALAPGGILLLSSANCEAPGFTSSAFVTRVYPARELAAMMETHGFQTRLMAGFEVRASGIRARVASAVRRLALALHLVPATLVGRERLKRLFYGPLTTLDSEIAATAAAPSLVPIDARGSVRGYKVIYAFGQVA